MLILLALLLTGMHSCVQSPTEKKAVIYINSYHRGFPPSDQITRGVLENLPTDSFEVYSWFMDTKRNTDEAYIRQVVETMRDSIEIIKPDAIIASDDNAMKYLVVPYLQGGELPVVFCGVNWSVDQYGLTGDNITGILEVLPVAELVSTIRPYYPEMQRLMVLNENTTTSRKTKPILDTLLGNRGLEVTQVLVDDFAEWKEAFELGNTTHDIIYLQTRGAIRGWEDEEAKSHIEEYIRVPLVTCEEFMMPYAVFGITQLSEEQGMRAAEMTKRILSGTDPSDLPVTRNRMTKAWVNPRWAEKIGFNPDEALKKRANVVE
jgi:ABC-type uncharacterized transport system substrate-binding protein